MKARVIVTLKPGVLDPQGKAIEGALKRKWNACPQRPALNHRSPKKPVLEVSGRTRRTPRIPAAKTPRVIARNCQAANRETHQEEEPDRDR